MNETKSRIHDADKLTGRPRKSKFFMESTTMSSQIVDATVELNGWEFLVPLAESFFERKKYIEAWLIYEWLEQWQAAFGDRIDAIRVALSAKLKGEAKLAAGKQIHSRLATDLQKRLRIAHLLSDLGDEKLLRRLFADIDLKSVPDELWLAQANAIAATGVQGWRGEWLECVNHYLAAHRVARLSLRPNKTWTEAGTPLYFNLEFAETEPVDGPLVTVHMSCFNAEQTVELAIRSIREQSYKNFELLIFDDCSTDKTVEIAQRLAAEDPRIRLTQNSTNRGTYANRNMALAQAKGEFFTVHDADDIAFPHRLSWAVAHLDAHRDHVGVVGEWLRVTENGRFVFKAWSGGYQHLAVVTLTVRTKQIKAVAGYWDTVRFAADTEFCERLRVLFGNERVPLVSMPLGFALFHSASLTSHPEYGVDLNGLDGWSPIRSEYAKNWKGWHAQYRVAAQQGGDEMLSGRHSLYLPFPASPRRFTAPQAMLGFASDVQVEDEEGASTTALLVQGNVLWRAGDLVGALTEFRRIPEHSPTYARAQFNIQFLEWKILRNFSAVATR